MVGGNGQGGVVVNSAEQTIDVLMAAIVVSSHNARKNLEAGSEDAGLSDLAQSIETMGLINPPSLRNRGDGTFEVVAGQRRVLACQKLGWTTIPAYIRDWSDDTALGASLVENLQRADMHPLDKARGLEELSKRLGSDREAAKNTGLSVQTVKKYISLLTLPEFLRSQLNTGQGPSGIGVMSSLAKQFGDDEDAAREAWEKIDGFSGGVAQRILNESGGDLGRLEELRQQALDGDLHIDRCGTSLATCPWIEALPDATQEEIIRLVRRSNG
jgi:ParB/RepB/Spo0J family partition protein